MSKETLKIYLRKFIMACLYLILLMPFFYFQHLLFPFITGKIFIFQILVELIFAAYLILIFIDKDARPQKSWLLILVSGYMFIWILSSLLSMDPERSFWGNYERMSGTFTILHFFIFFLVAGSVLRTKNNWRHYLTFALVVSAAEAMIGIIQYNSVNLFLARGGGKIWGTLGNFIYVATYSIFHIFIGFLLLADRTYKIIFKNPFLVLVILLNLTTLYLSGSRGGYLGFLTGLFVVAVLFLLTTPHRKLKIITASALLLFLLLAIIIINFKTASFIKNFPVIGELANLNLKDGTATTRIMAWRIAIDSWREKQILGWGPENFYYAFNKYLDPKFMEKGGYYETWFDRPHNAVLETLATRGAVGLVMLLSIFLFILINSFRQEKRGKIGQSEFIFSAGLLSAYFVQNLFVFDQPTSYLLFYLILAWLQSTYTNQGTKQISFSKKYEGLSNTFLLVVIIIMFSSTFYFIYLFNIKSWQGAKLTVEAAKEITKNFTSGFELYKRAAAIKSPYQDDVEGFLGRAIHDRLIITPEFARKYKDYIQETITILEELVKNHPDDVFNIMTLSQFYVVIGQIEPAYFEKADRLLEQAVRLSPARQQVYYAWARSKVAQVKYDEARDILQKVVNFSPTIGESYWYLGIVEDATNNKTKALQYMEEALAKGYTWKSLGEILFMARIADETSQGKRVVELLKEALGRSKQANLYQMLSTAYAKVGNTEEAKKALERAIDLNPKIIEKSKIK